MTHRRRLYVVEERDEIALRWCPTERVAYTRDEGRKLLSDYRRDLMTYWADTATRAHFMTRLAVYVCSGRAR